MSDKTIAERLIERLEFRIDELEEENLLFKNIFRSRATARGKPYGRRKERCLKLIFAHGRKLSNHQ